MLKCLIALTSLLSGAAVAVPAWTWVDELGQRHYSDRPVEGATRIELGGGQTFSGSEARVSTPSASQPSAATEPEPVEYTVLALVTPEGQQTVFNIEGRLETEIVIFPPLEAGHRIDVILDQEHVEIGSRDIAFIVPDVWRGEHTMQAVVVDGAGKEIKRSLPVTFFVRQNSILNPN